ncbi:ATP-binding protein [Asticcacaulis solisilvae]|uniref:ATP-binding protein n=1 Tax=Asticcacaulis solisilvae TaxID=1217274 RepID=UPI003FD75DD5
MTRFRPPHLPLTVQILVLTLAAILVAQLVTVLAVRIAPVGQPPHYSTAEVVAAFDGTATGHRRNLTIRHSHDLPDELKAGNETNLAATLAEAMDRPAGDVRVVRRGVPDMVIATSAAVAPQGPDPRRAGGPPHDRMGPPDGEPGPGGPPPGGPGFDDIPPPPQGAGPASAGDLSEFIAARHEADGTWTIVEPSPEWEWLRRAVLWILGGILVMGPPAWWLARRITRPIRTFAVAADRLGRDPRAPAMPLDGPAEIGVAATAFNRMQARIQKYVSDRMSMVGAISHDLRTPLTRIRFKVEGLPDATRAAILSDVGQMEAMIADVLAFIRDSDQAGAREKLDLASLVACAVDDRAEMGGAVSLDEDEASPVVEAEPVALRRLIDNLIDNALKYGGTARVSVTVRGDEAVVAVADDGPGLPDTELERVFLPFYRYTEDHGETITGTGLGLAVCRATARAHGGDVRLHALAKGLVAELALPLAPSN